MLIAIGNSADPALLPAAARLTADPDPVVAEAACGPRALLSAERPHDHAHRNRQPRHHRHPADRYWGPQTERARQLFRIGSERFPPALIRAVGLQNGPARGQWPARRVAGRVGRADQQAAQEIADGARDADFPLPVWQTGSGTQTNMNANEVIANRANEILGQPLGRRSRCIRTTTSIAGSPPTTTSRP